MSSSSVIRLRAPCVPYTVVGLVASVIVNAFKCVFATRTRTHIGKEQNKIAPSITRCDSARAVVGETFDVWVVASLEHSRPNAILWDAGSSGGLTVFEVPIRSCLAEKASARARSARSQIAARKQSFFATIANAFPQRLFVCNDGQKTKALSRDINEVWHLANLAQL